MTWPEATTTWPDGTEGDTWDAPEVSGLAIVTTAEGCEEEVPVDVTTVAIVAPDLGPDVTVCPGESVQLDAGNPGAQYFWSSGGFAQTELVLDSGLVEVMVNLQGCSETGSMQVNWFADYPLQLGADVVLCEGETVTLNADVPIGRASRISSGRRTVDNEFEVTTGVYTVTATLNGARPRTTSRNRAP